MSTVTWFRRPYFYINDVRMFTVGAVLCDLLCYGGYKLGQYLDKNNANQEKRYDKEKGKSKNDVNNGNNMGGIGKNSSPKKD